MFEKYLITGAAGFLGRAVIAELKKKNAQIFALVLKNDTLAKELPNDVTVVYGDVCNEKSLCNFFSGANNQTCVIHCAGIVSVASNPGDKIYKVNVGGTNNILRHCEKNSVGKLVYVSSVHAIPEKAKKHRLRRTPYFLPILCREIMQKAKRLRQVLFLKRQIADLMSA